MTKSPPEKRLGHAKPLKRSAELNHCRKLLDGKLSGIERWVISGKLAIRVANERLSSPQRKSA